MFNNWCNSFNREIVTGTLPVVVANATVNAGLATATAQVPVKTTRLTSVSSSIVLAGFSTVQTAGPDRSRHPILRGCSDPAQYYYAPDGDLHRTEWSGQRELAGRACDRCAAHHQVARFRTSRSPAWCSVSLNTMGLRIGQLITRCQAPRRYQQQAAVVDQLARGRFASDLAGHLGPSLSRQPAIVRIRRLPMRIVIPASELNEDALSKAWTQAFGKALFTALAMPSGVGSVQVYRADSLAAFIAEAIHDLCDGVTLSWHHAEFEPLLGRGRMEDVVTLLCQWPGQTLEILQELAKAKVLDRVLGQLDELKLETVVGALSRSESSPSKTLSVADLVAAAQLAMSHPPATLAELRSRVMRCECSRSIRKSRVTLPTYGRCSTRIERWQSSLPGAGSRESLYAESSVAALRLPDPVVQLLEMLQKAGSSGSETKRTEELVGALAELRSKLNLPEPSLKTAEAKWISSEWSGLFFLVSTLERLRWVPAWETLEAFRAGGASCLLAGLALSIAGKFETSPRNLDAGVALFAGYSDEPDFGHLARVFEGSRRQVRTDLLRASFPPLTGATAQELDLVAEDWLATFDRLAGHLVTTFASRIRGFRGTSRQGIVKTFLQRPGRVRIEDERIVVVPDPSPFHVALNLAGLLSPLGPVAWLGGRRLEFDVEDL